MTAMRTLFFAGPGIECRTDLIGPPPLIGAAPLLWYPDCKAAAPIA